MPKDIKLVGLLSGVALSAMACVAMPAYAQTAPASTQGSNQPAVQTTEDNSDEVVVVGTRASLRSAIDRKKKAGTVVDSIVAEDIGNFPDKNVGESLARVTGVQLSREFGEGTAVSIRGVEPDLNRIEINGVSQQSATGTRSGDFRELASELVKSIDVYKGYTADLTEGGLGGTVKVETRKPLELKKTLVSVTAAGQYQNVSKTWRPRATVVVGTPRFLFDGLGILANFTYSDVTTRQDYISNTNYNRLLDLDRSTEKTVANAAYAAFNTYESCATVGGTSTSNATSRRLACETQFFDWAPTLSRIRNNIRRDKRISADVTLQYQVASNLRVFAEAQVNLRNQRLTDNIYGVTTSTFDRFALDAALPVGLNGATSRPRALAGSSQTDANHVVTRFTTALNAITGGTVAAPIYGGAANIVVAQNRDFSYDQESKYYLSGFEWDYDRFNLKGLVSRSNAHTENNTNFFGVSTGVSGIVVDRNNPIGVPQFTFPSAFNPAALSSYTDFTRVGANGQPLLPNGPEVNYRPGDNTTKETQFALDADWKVDLPLLKMIEIGGQHRRTSIVNYDGGGRTIISGGGTSAPVFQTSANVTQTTVITNNVTQRRIGNTFYITPAEYQALLGSATGLTQGAPLFTGFRDAPDGLPSRTLNPRFDLGALGTVYDFSAFNQDLVRESSGVAQIPANQVDEKISAAYLKGNFATLVLGMRLTGNAGVRYIKTQTVGTGTFTNRVTRINPVNGSTETVTLSASQGSITNSYTDWLPAFNAMLEITPTVVFRANWAKNLARPKPTDLVPNINCLDDTTIAAADDVCTGGNPALLPYRANQWEVNLAWYVNRDTLFSVGYFKKDIKTFIVAAVTRTGVDVFNDGNTYTIRQPVNGFGALVDGIEASAQTAFTFLPKPFDGFGVSGNLTYSRALRTNLTNLATGEPLNDYPGLSKWSYNASVFYDKGWLNARLNYNFRSDWMASAFDASNGNLPIYRKAEGYLDGKITFRLPKTGYSVFFEGLNLTRQGTRSYIKNIGTSEAVYAGQRFFAGVQAKF